MCLNSFLRRRMSTKPNWRLNLSLTCPFASSNIVADVSLRKLLEVPRYLTLCSSWSSQDPLKPAEAPRSSNGPWGPCWNRPYRNPQRSSSAPISKNSSSGHDHSLASRCWSAFHFPSQDYARAASSVAPIVLQTSSRCPDSSFYCRLVGWWFFEQGEGVAHFFSSSESLGASGVSVEALPR